MAAEAITIRDAETRDLEAVRALLAETWHDTYDVILGRSKVSDITASWHAVPVLAAQRADPDSVFLVAICGGVLAGHALARNQGGSTALLSRLYVLPAFQRDGIGARLLHAVLARFPDARRMRLEVEPRNAKGRAFYDQHGFVVTGTVEEEGSRPVAMEKILRP